MDNHNRDIMSLHDFLHTLSAFGPQSLANEDDAAKLEECQRNLEAALKAVQGRLAKIESKRKQEVALSTIERLKAAGFDSAQIEAVRKSLGVAPSDKSEPAPKYRNPENYEMTWSGRGREPLWIQKYYNVPGEKASGYQDEVHIEWQERQKAEQAG